MAIDTHSTLDVRQLTIKELRGERDRLRHELDQCPKDRRRELERATARCEAADQALAQLTRSDQDQQRQPSGMLRRLRRDQQPSMADRGTVTVATQLADRAAERERELRQHQQARAGWLEGHPQLGHDYRQVVRELAWQRRARGLAQEALDQDRPGYVRELLGPVPESTRRWRAWRQAAGAIEQYRQAYDVQDQQRALGAEPKQPAQWAAWQQAQAAAERVHGKHRAERDRQHTHQQTSRAIQRQPTDPARPQPERDTARHHGPERATG